MNGWVRYLLSLAWDVTTLIHAGEPPEGIIARLRDRTQYQGGRYELAIAATFARLDCSIRWLDADASLGSGKRVEFEATFRLTVKRPPSRRRAAHGLACSISRRTPAAWTCWTTTAVASGSCSTTPERGQTAFRQGWLALSSLT